MDAGDSRISLPELAAAGCRLRPSDAVAIVRELALQVLRGELPGIPSAAVIRLTASGSVAVEGPVAADSQTIPRAAQLLDSLLPATAPPAGAAGMGREFRTPGGLRLVIGRASGTLDLPPFESLGDFVEALVRFAPTDPRGVVGRLFQEASRVAREGSDASPEATEPADGPHSLIRTDRVPLDGDGLTVSDIRRARRATGLTLSDVAEHSRIPAWLLRELEWGYYTNWPAGLYGRTQLVRYARGAGLDEQVVVRTLWPELEEFARQRGSTTVRPEDVRPADPHAIEPGMMLIPIEPAPMVHVPRRAGRRRRAALAYALFALLVVATLPTIWPQRTDRVPDSLVPPTATESSASETAPATPAPTHVRATIAPAFTSVGTAAFDPDRSGLARSTLRITRVLGDDERNLHARMSPDGSLIAFDSDRDGERAVFVASSDGRNVRRVSGEGFAAIPSWSPDGRTLAFTRAEPDNPEVWNLWTVNVATGELRRVTSYGAGQPWGASWFPDGARIAFTMHDRLVILDLATAAERIIPFPLKRRRLGTPTVSPDGRQAIAHVEDSGGWLVDLDDGTMRRVLDDPSASDYAWSPDGRRIAYHSGRRGKWNVLIP